MTTASTCFPLPDAREDERYPVQRPFDRRGVVYVDGSAGETRDRLARAAADQDRPWS